MKALSAKATAKVRYILSRDGHDYTIGVTDGVIVEAQGPAVIYKRWHISLVAALANRRGWALVKL